ncbi:hypothetical protein I553_8654 [Mycobacterium xenopi 4042]|uniref:Uncharacterized protein n=1 Tax=Mycobacterium xenopi 4042 TaxID=1299334 RepID=X8CL86_MYCXE|nr:hypothetical protein I553_8654 [Mycobacterium xenopi 4042]
MDDELAASLASGGRLDILLSSVEFATSRDVDPDGAVARSLCLAVDPDLLVTVNAMTGGYVVSDAPDSSAQQPGTPTHPGAGQAAAVSWLDRLRALAHRMCVASTTYAQADLDAVQRVADPGLTAAATSSAADIVDQILGISSVRGAALMPDGPLTPRVIDLLNSTGIPVTVAAADISELDGVNRAPATADLVPRRLAPTWRSHRSTRPSAPHWPPPVSTRARRPTWGRAGGTAAPRFGHRAPPGRAGLDVVAQFATQRRAARPDPDATGGLEFVRHRRPSHPHHLGHLDSVWIGGSAPTASRDRRHPGGRHGTPPIRTDTAAHGRFDDDVTAQIAAEAGRVWGLTAALTSDARTGLTGAAYTAPLREDMLRAVSQSEPRIPATGWPTNGWTFSGTPSTTCSARSRS